MKRMGRADWERHLVAQSKSGERVVSYCRAHGLNPSSFSYWRSVLKKEPEARFVPVGGTEQAKFIEFHHPSGVVVKAPSESTVRTLRTILEALGC